MHQLTSMTILVCSVCLSIIVVTVVFIFFLYSHRHRHRHRSPPSCSSGTYPIIGNIIGLLRNRHRFHDWVADQLAASHSLTISVHTFSSHGVCTANPAVLRHLLVSNFPNYVKGSRYSAVLRDLLGDGIFAADGHLWASQRKIASFEFTTNSLRRFIAAAVRAELSGRLLPLLSAACDAAEAVDLQDVLRRFAFDNICSVAFGVDPQWLSSDGLIKNSHTDSFVRAFDDAVEISFARFLAPVQAVWRIKRAFNVGSERRLKEAIRVIDEYAMDIIALRESQVQRNHDDQLDLLFRFISSKVLEFRYEEHKRRFLRDIVVSFVLAGKDSTSTALTWFFWLLAGHPRCSRLIAAELSEKKLDFSSYDDLRSLRYLHAALSESLRLFPPVPINSRVALADDVLPDGTRVGRGWFADYAAYAMGRMERIWGADFREFRPERWLDGAGEFSPADQFKFPVFHCGPRMCLGKEMAYVQMKSVAAAVLREYEVVAVDGGATAERMAEPPYTVSLLLKMRGGLPVRLKRRR